jgi:hypothetical protein
MSTMLAVVARKKPNMTLKTTPMPKYLDASRTWFDESKLPDCGLDRVSTNFPTTPDPMLDIQADRPPEFVDQAKRSCITWLFDHAIDYLHPKDPALAEMTLSDLRFYYHFNAYYFGVGHYTRRTNPPPSPYDHQDRSSHIINHPDSMIGSFTGTRPSSRLTGNLAASSRPGTHS